MKIRDILNRQRTVSFEFFPPRERDRIPAVFKTIDRLSVFRPSFMSVTYGAGGSTRALTEEMAMFFRACVQARLNLLIAGGAGTGKTTLLNVLAGWIPPGERVVTIEDAAELRLPIDIARQHPTFRR